MSRYTIQLRNVCDLFTREDVESWFKDYELTDYLTDDEISVINDRGTWNKDKLAHKIVEHYWMCEIGYETPALFRHQVKEEMQEIMEEYLPLIYSASIAYDPLVNVDYTESYESSDSGSSSGSSSADGLVINSDTPQGQVSKETILAGNYATSTSGTDNSSSSSASSSSESEYTKRVKGNSGVSATAQRMVAQYRDNIRAIDREIIEKLNRHFMAIY